MDLMFRQHIFFPHPCLYPVIPFNLPSIKMARSPPCHWWNGKIGLFKWWDQGACLHRFKIQAPEVQKHPSPFMFFQQPMMFGRQFERHIQTWKTTHNCMNWIPVYGGYHSVIGMSRVIILSCCLSGKNSIFWGWRMGKQYGLHSF